MDTPGRSSRCRLARWTLGCLGALAFPGHAEPATGATAPWIANYPSSTGSSVCESVAVPLDGSGLLVTVIAPGAKPVASTLLSGNRNVPFRWVGYDPVTRLGFLMAGGSVTPGSAAWLEDSRAAVGTSLRAESSIKCLASGWVTQIGGKVLPLALLRVHFERSIPRTGTPLTDASGRVVAIVFQTAGDGNSAYALPAEAVHRVRRDVCSTGRLARGWLGLSLRSESRSPKVVRVLPDSPAAKVGILPDDILVRVDSRQISDYADAANAFFYLVPGQASKLTLLRQGKHMEFVLTPVQPRAD